MSWVAVHLFRAKLRFLKRPCMARTRSPLRAAEQSHTVTGRIHRPCRVFVLPAAKPANDAAVEDLNGFIVVPTGDVVKITEDASVDSGFREEAVGTCKRTLKGSGSLPLYDLDCQVEGKDFAIKMIDSSNVTGRSFQDLGRAGAAPK